MHMLYDSESFVVVHMQVDAEETASPENASAVKKPTLARNGFEIVDKRSGKRFIWMALGLSYFNSRLLLGKPKHPLKKK